MLMRKFLLPGDFTQLNFDDGYRCRYRLLFLVNHVHSNPSRTLVLVETNHR
jgi:hypothetical protein